MQVSSSSANRLSAQNASEPKAAPKVRFGWNETQIKTLTDAVIDMGPKVPKTGFLAVLNRWTGNISSIITPVSSLMSAGSTLVQTFFGHALAVKRLERSAEINKAAQERDHSQKTDQNYQIATSAAAVIGLGILGAAKGMAWLNAKRLTQQLEGAYERVELGDVQKSHFKNLVGHASLKDVLEKETFLRVTHPDLFPEETNSAVLMHGPSGTGKTFAVKCLANKVMQAGMPVEIIIVNAGALVSEPGVASRILNKLHSDIKELTKNGKEVFLILDEAEALGSRANHTAGSEASKAITSLLQKVDGINGFKNVSLFAMTNRIEDLDDAFLNRIRHKISVDEPDQNDLHQIFNDYINRTQTLKSGDSLQLIPPPNLNMRTVIEFSEGLTGRSVKNSINNVIDRVILENIETLKEQKEAVLKQHVPPPPSMLQKLASFFVQSPPPPPPVITYKISFTESQLLAAIKQVKGADTPKPSGIKQELTKSSSDHNPFQTLQTAELNNKGYPYPPKGMDMPFRLTGSNGIQVVLPEAAPAA